MKQMKLNKKTWMIIPAVLLVGLCGCSSASSGSSSYVEMAQYDEAKASADITAETNGAGINYGYQAEEADMEAEILTQSMQVKLRGPKNLIDQLTPEDISVVVNLADAQAGTFTVKGAVMLPPHFGTCGLIKAESVSVTWRSTMELAEE
jgi:hypothetical protein